jgi:hypothetical protein
MPTPVGPSAVTPGLPWRRRPKARTCRAAASWCAAGGCFYHTRPENSANTPLA